MIDKTREIALKVLYDIDKNGAYSNIALNEELKKQKQKIESKNIGLISEIIYGTTTWKLTIDEIIKKYSNIRIKKISPWILNVLRMSIYQIIFLDKIPKSAAVNESVKLAKRYGHSASSGFVNAILRKVSKKDFEELFQIKDDIKRISVTTSMPIWIVQELLKQESLEKVEQICKDSNLRPNLSIRVNNLKTSIEELKVELEKENIKVKKGVLTNFVKIEGVRSLEKINAFKSGHFTVQDEAAGLVPIILNPKPGEKVLDACSSPGGKTTYLAQIMENKGEIIAWDIYQHRVDLVKENAKRLGNEKIIKAEVKDATIYDEKYFEYFDKILLDVPCLGIGVLKRKPDIKWKRKKENIEEITKLQYDILQNCSKYLKPQGELVYSTCSILKEENENIIQKFVKNSKNFVIVNLNYMENKFFKKYLKKEIKINVYQNQETDGFFICKLKRN